MSTNPASDTTPSSSTLPTDVFEGVAPSLVRLVQTIYREDENATQHKQSVAAAVRISRATVLYRRTDASTTIFRLMTLSNGWLELAKL